MSLMRKLALSVIPRRARGPIKRALRRSNKLFGYPFLDPFCRRIIRLEDLPRASSLDELKPFEELRGSAWLGLERMAYQIVTEFKPKVIVELGTHMGLSALAMGLALRDLGEGGKLYAVDSWEGDPQAGFYAEEVYQTFCSRIKSLGLESIVFPRRMYFDEARDQVETPIDLLHIDGLHTWEAVNHDFDTFGPLVRPGGVVMFHDVNTSFNDLRKFWAMLTKKYHHYMIEYCHGLGLIEKK